MSVEWESLHPATRESIELQALVSTKTPEWECGCLRRDNKTRLCTFHDAFDVGAQAASLEKEPPSADGPLIGSVAINPPEDAVVGEPANMVLWEMGYQVGLRESGLDPVNHRDRIHTAEALETLSGHVGHGDKFLLEHAIYLLRGEL